MDHRIPPRRGAWLGASLAALAAANPALAVDISSGVATPVATSTVNGGSPADVNITSSGSVQPTGGAAVTLDSDNTVTNAGTVKIQDANASVGVLATGAHTGAVTNNATIQVDETTTATDSDGDGDLDGPLATGSGRYGIRTTGALNGSITNGAAGVISVKGDDSAGLSVEAPLAGSIVQAGTVAVTGARSVGVKATGGVGGDMTVTGAVSATGGGASAVVLGDVAGAVKVQSAVTATGYRSVTRTTDATALGRLDADDLLQGGPAMWVAGDLGRGLVVDTLPTGAGDIDADGDGIVDNIEGTGSIVSYGAAPALQIGAAGRSVTLGAVGSAPNDYGLIQRGFVTGAGVYDGVAATALQIGVAGGGATRVEGGIYNSGSIGATALTADATGLHLLAGASVPRIYSTGVIAADIVGDNRIAATGLKVESGASLPLLQTGGIIRATVKGEAGDAIAIQDLSGTLKRIENVGVIAATITSTDDSSDTDDADIDASNEKITGRAVAIDVQANTSGVAIVQSAPAAGITPSISGDVLLGSGDDTVQILGGTLTGAVSFGAGANSLLVDSGASVIGAITASGGTLGVSLRSGALSLQNVGVLNLSSLSVGSGGTLGLTVDPASNQTTQLVVAGPAALASGAKISLRLTSLINAPSHFTLIQAQSLSSAVADASLLGQTPFLYNVALATDAAAGRVDVNLSRKTAAELGLPAATASAYEPIVAASAKDAEVQAALLAPTDAAGVKAVYDQLLPDHAGDVFESVAAGVTAASRALDDRAGAAKPGFWVQETNVGVVRKADSASGAVGYKAWGLGLIGGYELAPTRLGAVGVTVGASSSRIDQKGASPDEDLTVNLFGAGGYWRAGLGGLSVNLRAGGDYLSARSRRAIAVRSAEDALILSRKTEGDWSGWALSARAAASYDLQVGRFAVRPNASLDYLRLREGGYSESGGGEAIDLDVDARTSRRLSAFAGLTLATGFGDAESSWGPEVTVGWRKTASQSLGATIARFKAGGESFALDPDTPDGGGFSARVSLKGENGGGAYAIEAGTERRDGLAIYELRLAGHLFF
jgi:uncharacterized protein with beta-barrel porin domain